jgi:cation:H+ antiporter
MIITNFLILVVSSVLLVKAGTWVVKSLTKIARVLGWSEFLVTFFFMAIATSFPELFIGVDSAFRKLPQLAFGNIMGANILNLTVGIALAALVSRGLELKGKGALRKDFFFAIALSLLPFFLILDGAVSRVDGIILLLAFSFYLKKVFREKKKFTKVFNHRFKGDLAGFKKFIKNLMVLFGSIILLLISSEGVVKMADSLAIELNIPLVITGLLFVSLGTALPEIVFGIRAVLLRHEEMVLGNFLGSVVVNSTLIFGIVSLISPLKLFDFTPYILGISFTFLVSFAFWAFSLTGRKIAKSEAIFLILLYLVFAMLQFASL